MRKQFNNTRCYRKLIVNKETAFHGWSEMQSEYNFWPSEEGTVTLQFILEFNCGDKPTIQTNDKTVKTRAFQEHSGISC